MVEELYQKYLESGKVATDTRQITPGSVFFALRGEKFNANDFAAEALARGAVAAVVDEPRAVKDDRYILVKDSLQALQDLARHHRSRLQIPFIGLTGSNGKTTTKELVHAVLSTTYKTFATRGNLNNHIGVPLTVLAIDADIEMAVVEMGANHLGEIALLCSICRPTHGVITNIGKAHIGTFGGFENIVRGKSELYQYLLENKGTVFINSGNPILKNMSKRFSQPVLYPAAGDFYHGRERGADPFLQVEAENGDLIRTHLVGAYNFENVATALCIGKYFQVESRLANEAIAGYVPGNMRSQVVQKGTNTIILDAYNANPSSMQAAIENFAAITKNKKVVILGDMFELEQEAEKEHRAIGSQLREKNFDRVYLCGEWMRFAASEIPGVLYFPTKEAMSQALQQQPIADATVLIKASRGMGLETILEIL